MPSCHGPKPHMVGLPVKVVPIPGSGCPFRGTEWFCPRHFLEFQKGCLVEVTPIPEDTETKCYKILLIEDDQSLNEPLQYALQQQGYEVRSTTDGRDVTGLLDLIDPDLVVTDIIMPDIDMLDLITSLRLSRPQIKII